MNSGKLRIDSPSHLKDGRMVLAFTGWMDGGEVSTGTVKRLIDELGALPVGVIESEGFYIYNFPGDMEVTALFRPHIKIEDGLVKKFDAPTNVFYCDEGRNLAFFVGREPNLNWREFGDCIFESASQLGISSLFFVGSFAGTVPHTREPRLHVSVSEPRLKADLERYGLRPTNYEGPGSFMTYLTTQAAQRGMEMANIVAEIPAYVRGENPSSIEAVTRRLAAILRLEVDLSRLRSASNDWERSISEAIENDTNMAQQIRQLEEQYDDDLITATDYGLSEDDPSGGKREGAPDVEGDQAK